MSVFFFFLIFFFFFFFNDTATTEIYTLSLHDALPISALTSRAFLRASDRGQMAIAAHDIHPTTPRPFSAPLPDRKSTRLNSSHLVISYAVFCLKKKTSPCLLFNAFYSKIIHFSSLSLY